MNKYQKGWRTLQADNSKLTKDEKISLLIIIALFLIQAYFEQPY